MTRRWRCAVALTLGVLVGETLGLAVLGERPETPRVVATVVRPVVLVADEDVKASAEARPPTAVQEDAVREASSTWIVQLRVGAASAEVLAGRHKPALRFRPDARPATGPFEVRARDAHGRTWSGRVDPAGLAPADLPAAMRRADGAWVRGDEVLLPAVPVLVKLPGSLSAPVQVEVRGQDGRLLGAGSVG